MPYLCNFFQFFSRFFLYVKSICLPLQACFKDILISNLTISDTQNEKNEKKRQAHVSDDFVGHATFEFNGTSRGRPPC